jgi:hypothetical protein
VTDRLAAKLAALLAELPEDKRLLLLEYAEFLHARYGVSGVAAGSPEPASAPLDIPRPAEETVVRAIKRLRATYPMLNSAKLLDETTVLMTEHVMQGREAVEVIDELEVLFRAHYERIVGEKP